MTKLKVSVFCYNCRRSTAFDQIKVLPGRELYFPCFCNFVLPFAHCIRCKLVCVSQGVSLTGGVALAVPPASSSKKKRLVLAEVNLGFTLTSMGAPIQHQSRLSYSGKFSAQVESCKAMQCAAQFENVSCSQGLSSYKNCVKFCSNRCASHPYTSKCFVGEEQRLVPYSATLQGARLSVCEHKNAHTQGQD